MALYGAGIMWGYFFYFAGDYRDMAVWDRKRRKLLKFVIIFAVLVSPPASAFAIFHGDGPNSLVICGLKPGERVVIQQIYALEVKSLETKADERGIAKFHSISDGYWSVVEGGDEKLWSYEIPFFNGYSPSYQCFNTT